MQNVCRLTIDGNDVTFEVAQMRRGTAEYHEIDPSEPALVVTTMRDGNTIWSGVGTWNVTNGAPVTPQFTTEQLIEIYRQARYRWITDQVRRRST